MKIGRLIGKKLLSFCSWLQKTSVMLGVLMSAILAGVAVLAGLFYVPTKPLGVFVSAVGCFLSGWLFAGFFSKARVFAKLEGTSDRELSEKLEKTEKEKDDAERQAAQLREENNRLKHQRIEINKQSPVLKLGLQDAEMTIKDVVTEWMDDFDDGGILSRPSRSRYLGVLQQSFRATFGVDLIKFCIREEPDRIHVAGIESENIGFKNFKEDWLIQQRQRCKLVKTTSKADSPTSFEKDGAYYEIDKSAEFSGDADLNKIEPFSKEQKSALQERLNQGIGDEFANINNYIRNMAKEYIRLLLAPVGKAIEFDATPVEQISSNPEWKKLKDYANEYNHKLELPLPDSNGAT